MPGCGVINFLASSQSSAGEEKRVAQVASTWAQHEAFAPAPNPATGDGHSPPPPVAAPRRFWITGASRFNHEYANNTNQKPSSFFPFVQFVQFVVIFSRPNIFRKIVAAQNLCISSPPRPKLASGQKFRLIYWCTHVNVTTGMTASRIDSSYARAGGPERGDSVRVRRMSGDPMRGKDWVGGCDGLRLSVFPCLCRGR